MHEVEVRGPLNNFDNTFQFFKAKGRFIQEKDRFQLIYFPKETLNLNEMENDPRDLRLRVTNKKAELVMKYGEWGAKDSRHEITIPVPLDKFDEMAELLNYLGWGFGSSIATKTFIFNFKGIEFALVKTVHGDYFEAEKLIHEKEDSDIAMKEIEKVCSELNLRLFSKEEYYKFMDKINNAVGAIFNFKKQKFSEIKSRYKEFF